MIGTRLEYRLRDDDGCIITLQHSPHTPNWGQCTTAIFLVTSWWTQQTVFQDSTHWFTDTALQIVIVRESAAAQWNLHLVKQRKPPQHQDALCPPEDCGHLLASKGSCPKFLGPTAPSTGKQMTTVKCDYVAVTISQPVIQVSPSHFWTTFIYCRKGDLQGKSTTQKSRWIWYTTQSWNIFRILFHSQVIS
jgi:hypothetical protein